MIDWRDIGQHGAAGLVLGIPAGLLISLGLTLQPGLPGYIFLVLGIVSLIGHAFYWLGREVHQRHVKGQSWTRLFTSKQVLLEWFIPIPATCLGAWAGYVFSKAVLI